MGSDKGMSENLGHGLGHGQTSDTRVRSSLIRTYLYSTTHTDDAVFIISGYHTGNIVAEFKYFTWQEVASLRQARSRHASITLGNQTIIIGGSCGAK